MQSPREQEYPCRHWKKDNARGEDREPSKAAKDDVRLRMVKECAKRRIVCYYVLHQQGE